jgi:hypothetical protein
MWSVSDAMEGSPPKTATPYTDDELRAAHYRHYVDGGHLPHETFVRVYDGGERGITRKREDDDVREQLDEEIYVARLDRLKNAKRDVTKVEEEADNIVATRENARARVAALELLLRPYPPSAPARPPEQAQEVLVDRLLGQDQAVPVARPPKQAQEVDADRPPEQAQEVDAAPPPEQAQEVPVGDVDALGRSDDDNGVAMELYMAGTQGQDTFGTLSSNKLPTSTAYNPPLTISAAMIQDSNVYAYENSTVDPRVARFDTLRTLPLDNPAAAILRAHARLVVGMHTPLDTFASTLAFDGTRMHDADAVAAQQTALRVLAKVTLPAQLRMPAAPAAAWLPAAAMRVAAAGDVARSALARVTPPHESLAIRTLWAPTALEVSWQGIEGAAAEPESSDIDYYAAVRAFADAETVSARRYGIDKPSENLAAAYARVSEFVNDPRVRVKITQHHQLLSSVGGVPAESPVGTVVAPAVGWSVMNSAIAFAHETAHTGRTTTTTTFLPVSIAGMVTAAAVAAFGSKNNSTVHAILPTRQTWDALAEVVRDDIIALVANHMWRFVDYPVVFVHASDEPGVGPSVSLPETLACAAYAAALDENAGPDATRVPARERVKRANDAVAGALFATESTAGDTKLLESEDIVAAARGVWASSFSGDSDTLPEFPAVLPAHAATVALARSGADPLLRAQLLHLRDAAVVTIVARASSAHETASAQQETKLQQQAEAQQRAEEAKAGLDALDAQAEAAKADRDALGEATKA